MTNWKEKQKEWHEKYDDMFQEFPATESEARRKMIDIYEAHEIFFQYKRRRLWIMTTITIILMFGPPTLAQIMGADREIVGKVAYSIMIFCPVLVAEAQLLIKNGSGIRTCKKKLKQIEKNEVGSYLEEAESFYKRVEERRKKSHEKRISVLLLCCIVFISGCNMPGQDDQKIKKLDPEKLDSETTDINDRADYYEKYVTEPGDQMDEEERSKYRVTLHMVYKNAEQYQQDMIIFLRNDNVVEGSMDVGEPDIGLLPGVFRVISMMIEEHDSNLGEIEILEPGMEYTLTIDYAQKKAILSDYDEHK